MNFMAGLLICLIPGALGVVLFGVDEYLIRHPEFKEKFKERLGRH